MRHGRLSNGLSSRILSRLMGFKVLLRLLVLAVQPPLPLVLTSRIPLLRLLVLAVHLAVVPLPPVLNLRRMPSGKEDPSLLARRMTSLLVS